MAELKTKKTEANVSKFLAGVANEQLRADALVVLGLMKQATKAEPRMWGPSIIGFGDQRLVYESGRELDWFVCGFSPRKSGLVLYLAGGISNHGALLKKLGRHKTGKGCLYLGPLDEVDLPTLKALIAASRPGSRKPSKAK